MNYSKHLLKNGNEMYLFDNTTFFNHKITGSSGIYQKRNLDFIKSLRPHFNIIIDGGTHVGMNTIQYAKIADKVYSIEASPETYKLLQLNVELYNITNAVLYNFPISNIDGETVNFKHFDGDEGNNRIVREFKGDRGIPFILKTRTLDSILQSEKDKIDVIKLDIEGYEMKALLGAENTLNNHKPILQIEIFDNILKRNGHSAQQLYDYLYDLGYCAYNFKGELLSRKYEKVKRICDTFFIHPINH